MALGIYNQTSHVYPDHAQQGQSTHCTTSRKSVVVINSYEVLQHIRADIKAIGFDILGLNSSDVRTRNNRGVFAMMLYLTGTPVFTITKLERLLPDAFLDYIEPQIFVLSK